MTHQQRIDPAIWQRLDESEKRYTHALVPDLDLAALPARLDELTSEYESLAERYRLMRSGAEEQAARRQLCILRASIIWTRAALELVRQDSSQ